MAALPSIDALGSGAMDLALDDLGVDDAAAVMHHGIAFDLHPPVLRVDGDLHDMGAVGHGDHRRVVVVGCLQPVLVALRHAKIVHRIGGRGDLSQAQTGVGIIAVMNPVPFWK